MLKGAKVEFYVEYRDWDDSPEFNAEDFQFTPPEDATEVDDLFGGGLNGDDDTPHPLLGKPALEFAAKNLDGNEVELKKSIGDDVVILDFWATWCGPCVEALPVITIGYNGGTGLHVLDHQGRLLWKYTDIGNVWHVASGDVDGDGSVEVVTTSAQGAVHVFDAMGKNEKNIRVPLYASFIRTVKSNDKDVPHQMLVAGTGDSGETGVLIDSAGKVQFSVDLPDAGTAHVDDLAVSNAAQWAGFAMRGGLIHVVDLKEGDIVATVAGQGMRPSVAWQPRNDSSPLLVVATGEGINAFEVVLDE